MLSPHGGKLIIQLVDENKKWELIKKATPFNTIEISSWILSDLELIATGAYSPLTGFMDQANYQSVLAKMRLKNGIVWPLPVTLPILKKQAENFNIGDEIFLTNEGIIYGSLHLEEKFEYSKEYEALSVYGTTDATHPGVKRIQEKGEVYFAGPIQMINHPPHSPFEPFYFTPKETRELFQSLKWNTIVGFQTRNPIHRAHEYLQKVALESVDGLLIHPLIGETKSDDIPAKVRMESYQVLIQRYYPKDRVRLVVFPAAMRYAGPREAVFHAIVRKNYGCTHFIVGRDHAGVGNYYGTYDAQKIFDLFSQEEIGISILKFEHAFFCTICGQICTAKTCPHESCHHLHFSGTKVREMLRNGVKPPEQFSRPEVVETLLKGIKDPNSNEMIQKKEERS
jgi:sulfate adenylyltransferase